MDWKDVGQTVAKVAPILGAVLGGPVGAVAGAAGGLLGQLFGCEPEPQAVMQSIQADPQAMVKIQELAVQKEALLIGWQEKQLEAEIEDRKSARARDVALVQAKGGNRRGDVLAFAAIAGLIATIYTLLFVEIPPTAEKVFLLLAGGLIAIVKDVYGFEFGSSRGSKEKDLILGGAK